jgi:CheY-like chemotaxis protein
MASASHIEVQTTRWTSPRPGRSSAAGPDSATEPKVRPKAVTGTASHKSVRIAIVDNDEELGSLFSALITRLGYLVEFVAHGGGEIVKAVSDGDIHPDIILMDYRMPGMNGIQAAKKVLRFAPETQIILATADDQVRGDAVSAGLYFLLKPFSTPTLVRTIEDAVGRRKGPELR